MLIYESLIEQAKMREMPTTKMRGILREYLQILILKELYRYEAGSKLCFTGDTYLRLVHQTKRFSEDLDFNTSKLTKSEFEDLLKKICIELKRANIETEIVFNHWQNIYAAKIVFPKIEKLYNIISRYSNKKGIMIKVETNKPKYRLDFETQLITGFGEIYPCVCTDKSILFADKIDALSKKNRARHIYDIIFMLANKYPINRDVLKIFNIEEDPLIVIHDRIKKYSTNELKNQAERLRPFLFDEKEADLIINAHFVIPELIKKYCL